jgi:hypothetical protein
MGMFWCLKSMTASIPNSVIYSQSNTYKMKTTAIIIVSAILLLTVGCKKADTNKSSGSEALKTAEALLNQNYSQSLQYQGLLIERHVTQGLPMSDSICQLYDANYHQQDTSFSMHLREYCDDMMEMQGMGSNGMMNGSNGMMGGSGGMMCNMDSLMMAMNGMMNMNTFKMDSMMMLHMTNCPAMGTMLESLLQKVNAMQVMRKEHATLHNQ